MLRRVLGCVLAGAIAVLATGDRAWGGGIGTVLSNTPVNPQDAAANFQGAVPTIWADVTNESGGVRIHSVAYRGLTGTPGEGFFLYTWQIDSTNPGTTYVTSFRVAVPGRTAFDLDGDTIAETSAYCAAYCVADLSGAVPDQVVVPSGDLVDFQFALLEHSTQLWMVSTHPPATAAADVTRAFALGDVSVDVVAPSASTAGLLSNVSLQWGTPAHTRMAQLFGINLGAFPAGDGYALDSHFYTGARAGNAGTAAEGLFLYEYWFETDPYCGGSNAAAHRMEIPFASLVPFDFDGDGANETSFYMPSSGGCGAAAVATTAEIDGDRLLFDYADGVPGGIANVFVVSDLPPNEIQGTLFVTGLGSGEFRTWSSAPEPATTLAGASAVAALAALRRRYRKA